MNQNPVPEADDTPEQIKVRQEKHARLLTDERQAHPIVLAITSTIAEIREKYSHLEVGDEAQDEVDIADRVMLARNGGKSCLATLMDGEGNRIRVMLSAAEVGLESLVQCKVDVNLGDHLFIYGRAVPSRRGELFVLACPGTAPAGLFTSGTDGGDPASAWQIVAKSIRLLPKTYTAEGGTEVSLSEGMCVRRRYLDMIVRPAARDMVCTRFKVVKFLRDYLDEAGFAEIETSILQDLHGGIVARPFLTHINAYNADLSLRVTPKPFLKRVVVGGINKVLGVNRDFRNEGVDFLHSPEFTMLEAYEAYGSYDTMARRTCEFAQKAARDTLGIELTALSGGSLYDLSGSWTEISMFEAIAGALGREFNIDAPLEELVRIAEELGKDVADHWGPDKAAEVIFEAAVSDKFWASTFVRDYPEDFSPLTRGHRSKKGIVEKWDLYMRGFESATAYSELVDPMIQRQRLEVQALAVVNGDPEAMIPDEDFLMVMEYGMPPTGGMGMGLGRPPMALTGYGIRETITFPLVKKL